MYILTARTNDEPAIEVMICDTCGAVVVVDRFAAHSALHRASGLDIVRVTGIG